MNREHGNGRALVELLNAPKGERSYQIERFAQAPMVHAILMGALLQDGLVRAVKHVDHTRSYRLTEAGRDAAMALAAE